MAEKTPTTPFAHDDPGEASLCLRPFGAGNRRAPASAPSGAMISSGGASSTPLIADDPETGDDSYTRMLSAELPQEAPEPAGLSLASFFCGCGGVDLGFRSAGFKLAFANDLYARAAESFEANLNHKPKLCDIRKVVALKHIPKVDVLTGGFPCVTFSMAGQRKGVEDSVNGMLYLELCRMIEQRQPRYFVAENVKGMVSSNGGSDIKRILAAFLRLGYRTTYELINMAEHGVPQTRERVIFVGVRADEWRGTFKFPAKTHRLRKDKKAKKWLSPARTLRQAIGDLPSVGTTLGMMHGDAAAKLNRPSTCGSFSNSIPRHVDDAPHSQTTQPNVLIVADVVPNHDQITGTAASSFGSANRRGDDDSPGPTIASAASSAPWAPPSVTDHEPNDAPVSKAYASSSRVAPPHDPSPTAVSQSTNVQPFVEDGKGMRRMTVRECARVQSFPDWYQFKGAMSDGYRQVGNAVPPLYAKRLAIALLEYDKRRIR